MYRTWVGIVQEDTERRHKGLGWRCQSPFLQRAALFAGRLGEVVALVRESVTAGLPPRPSEGSSSGCTIGQSAGRPPSRGYRIHCGGGVRRGPSAARFEIGRASCRERGEITVG